LSSLTLIHNPIKATAQTRNITHPIRLSKIPSGKDQT